MALAHANPETTLKAEGPVARRQLVSRASRYVFLVATVLGIGILVILGIDTVQTGAPALDWQFISSYPSRNAVDAGLRSSLFGTIWVMGTTILLAIPVAIGTAIFLEEFSPKGKITGLIRLNIANLAGVPSIIYGILGLTVFVRGVEFAGIQFFPALGTTILAGSLTLGLMVLPMIVIASVEALRQVPPSIRDGSLALGATRWQTVWNHTLPGAMPGIMTGTILAVSRAAGETAALIMIGAFAFIAFDNKSVNEDFTTVPIQIYNWTTRPQEAFRENAAAGIIVLMAMVIALNVVAVFIRERFSRK